MPNAVQPGTRLAGRYRLAHPVAGGGPRSAVPAAGVAAFPGRPAWAPRGGALASWQAVDELLARPVGVQVMPADAPYAAPTIAAARRAAAFDDPRFVAILDAATEDGLAYVVSEWVHVRDLGSLLRDGPLPQSEARWLAAEVARALAAAHDADLAHRCLGPADVLRTDSGRVKVSGLAVDAVLHGLDPIPGPDAAAADARGAAAVLYAGLTGRWPLGPDTALPAAPTIDGVACSPRQVRAAVPSDLDEVVGRALGCPGRRAGEPIASPAELAAALGAPVGTGFEAGTGPIPAVRPDDEAVVPLLAAPARPGRGTRVGSLLAGTLLTAGLALLSWQLADGLTRAGAAGGGAAAGPAAPDAGTDPAAEVEPGPRTGARLPVAEVSVFDPEPGDGRENGARAGLAVDGDPDTEWVTHRYFNSPFGGLKDGVGLLLDLGAAEDVATVTAHVRRGTSLQLRVAPAAGDGPPPATGDFRTVAAAEQTGTVVTLRPDSPVAARYVLLWLTELPPDGERATRGGIGEVEVRS